MMVDIDAKIISLIRLFIPTANEIKECFNLGPAPV